MGLFNRRSTEEARLAGAKDTTHPPPAGAKANYPANSTQNGYGGESINGKGRNKGPLGDRGMVTGNHGSVTNNTHAGPAPLIGSTSPGSSPRSSAETKHTEREVVRLARKGKTKDRMGKLLGNSRMKQEGEQLRAQSEHLRMQQVELDEAARLEHEAGMRRQRAVGMGADPVLASGTTGFAPKNNGATRY